MTGVFVTTFWTSMRRPNNQTKWRVVVFDFGIFFCSSCMMGLRIIHSRRILRIRIVSWALFVNDQVIGAATGRKERYAPYFHSHSRCIVGFDQGKSCILFDDLRLSSAAFIVISPESAVFRTGRLHFVLVSTGYDTEHFSVWRIAIRKSFLMTLFLRSSQFFFRLKILNSI